MLYHVFKYQVMKTPNDNGYKDIFKDTVGFVELRKEDTIKNICEAMNQELRRRRPKEYEKYQTCYSYEEVKRFDNVGTLFSEEMLCDDYDYGSMQYAIHISLYDDEED